ncbi:MAG: hypothetical protein PGN13_09005 [Patulibacter minatonensis]
MDRRALSLIAAASLFGLSAPASAGAATSAEALLAQSNTGTLTADGIAAGEDRGTLSEDAKPAASSRSSSSKGSGETSTAAVADELPFTGSDPRITLLLGAAAVLLGAGMRLRTRDVRDF